ncbi:MAG: 2-oxoglutarate dehydrogenase E1 component, partial [Leptospiraceae bacterium]|nr:2-oxoglutarate dehydrogenase E1 component [Leptospiraceae bacterium]
NRKKMYEGEVPIDWGFAEALAFGSILENGYFIRMSGQDSKRGTFSHRHAVLVDEENEREYVPLNHISDNQGFIEIINSPLSEFSVLGFEYGYSLSDPKTLVLWEAQFGDFVNGAQIMIDQFISSSEVKWHRMSGLVMLLPHGYEGQGPEHSSARLERFLQLCSSNNMQVCNCSTPAQYFHLLRRQMLRAYRKPLIIMSPKSLLRLPEAGSALDDISMGIFREVLHDPETKGNEQKITRLLFCSGKIYYDLRKFREEQGVENVAIARMEQIYPYPLEQVADVMQLYPQLKEVFWVQEEPRNQGAWDFLRDRLHAQLPSGCYYKSITRPPSPSPAAGLSSIHREEQEELVRKALL